jgi:hypothetical protein
MRKLLSALKRFFFPPADSARWLRVLPFAMMGGLTLVMLSGGVYGWTYTNSSEFCGTACHTMPPEYNAYLRSPHARVQCVECHIGRDVVTTQFTRKAGDLSHVYATLTSHYEFPIYSRGMRPARESCEPCHFAEKFSDDRLREVRRYDNDEANTAEVTYLVLKTGGGTKREGLGQGIHWHIENTVRFIALDPLQQEIPYVRVIDEMGQITEYYDVASDLTPEDVAGQFLETMDCITCHNRVTHTIPTPEQAVDQALRKKLIPDDLPYLRREAVALLSQKYAEPGTVLTPIDSLVDFYRQTYPEIFAERQEEIRQAIVVLEDIRTQIIFPEQRVDWDTHPDNLGHTEAPGCFRCHDGKHLTATGEAIRLECNICHAVPVVVDNTTLVTMLELVRGPEPTSHTHTSWMTLHGRAIDRSCAACHPPADPTVDYTTLEEKPPLDGSFCGNSACHANEWVYSGFGFPALVPILDYQLEILLNTSPYLLEGMPRTYRSTFKAMFDGRCVFCHDSLDSKGDLDMSSYDNLLQGGRGGPALVPGDPAASLLVQRQSGRRAHFGQVLAGELEALEAWIADGAPEK